MAGTRRKYKLVQNVMRQRVGWEVSVRAQMNTDTGFREAGWEDKIQLWDW
jgi:hypothetical protein